ncbi:B3 domain-containing protein, partial [Cephalotus follicularis]
LASYMAIFFSKLVTWTDIKHKMSVPSSCLKSLPCFGRGHARDILVRDESGHVWTFRCSIRKKKPLRPVFTKGWLAFARDNNLKVGHRVIFYHEEDHVTGTHYKIEVKKAIKVFG